MEYFVILSIILGGILICCSIKYFFDNYRVVTKTEPTIEEKKSYIIGYIKKYHYIAHDIPNEVVDDVYDAYYKHIIKDDTSNVDLIVFYAVYYQYSSQYNKMIKCFLRSFKLGNDQSLNILAIYYASAKDYQNAFKYCLLAIKNKNLLRFQKFIDLVVEQNSVDNLNKLYEINSRLFDDHIYTKIIFDAIVKLIDKNGYTFELISIIEQIDVKYFDDSNRMLFSYKKLLTEKINLLDLHFKYSPDTKGYMEAKIDFLKRL